MKKLIFTLLLFVFAFISPAQEWKKEQLSKANTVADITYLTEIEKETILYLNLARLYPKDFIKIELSGTSHNHYEASLIKTLKSMNPMSPMVFDETLYEFAKCYSKEMGDKGTVGHNRRKCKNGNFAECCSYGMNTGREVVLQLLIDEGVPSLGHRKICLSERFSKIGVSVHTHKAYGTCAVLDIK